MNVLAALLCIIAVAHFSGFVRPTRKTRLIIAAQKKNIRVSNDIFYLVHTEQNGNHCKKGAAQGVHHPEGGALEWRRIKGEESVASPHQEREDDSGGRRRQENLDPVGTQILAEIWREKKKQRAKESLTDWSKRLQKKKKKNLQHNRAKI